MKHTKKLLALACTLSLLACCLSTTAMAAEKTIYLDGYSDTYWGTQESTEEAGQLAVTGANLERFESVTYADQMGSADGSDNLVPFTSPVYRADAPVTVKLIAGERKDGPNSGVNDKGDPWITMSIVGLRVDEMTLEENTISLKQSHAAYFDGSVSLYGIEDDSEETCTIREYSENPGKYDDFMPSFCRGATVTLSKPGIYRVEAYLEALAGGCEVFIQIGGETAPATPDAPAGAPSFTDVAATSPFAAAIDWAVEQGITNGTTDTTFSPGQNCTTGQILTFLWRANGSPEPTAANPYTDVDESAYYYKAALWAHEKGMVSGTSLEAAAACTRSQTMTYLWKLAGQPEAANAAAFTDVDGSADYAQAVAWAVEQKITSGTTDTTFSPDNICTRGQIVTFLYRNLAE